MGVERADGGAVGGWEVAVLELVVGEGGVCVGVGGEVWGVRLCLISWDCGDGVFVGCAEAVFDVGTIAVQWEMSQFGVAEHADSFFGVWWRRWWKHG